MTNKNTNNNNNEELNEKVHISAKVPMWQKEDLKKIGDKRGATLTDVLKQAIASFLKKES